MSNIQYIKNFTTYQGFNASIGQWTQAVSMPSVNPDMCIVRGITYLGPSASTKVYLIWCSLTNDYIGSLNVDNISTQSPGTRIMLNSPVPNSLTFQLYLINTVNNTISIDPAADGDIAIHLEFIKYRDTPSHA
jgi:hypothetical protein